MATGIGTEPLRIDQGVKASSRAYDQVRIYALHQYKQVQVPVDGARRCGHSATLPAFDGACITQVVLKPRVTELVVGTGLA